MTIDEAVKLYRDFTKQITNQSHIVKRYLQERNLDFYGICESMNWVVERWKTRRKVCRPLKIIPLFKIIAEIELPTQLKMCLISLDAKINFLDEFIDNSNLDKKEKVNMAIVSVFNDLNVTLGLLSQPNKSQDLGNVFFEYLLFLSQIPSVEWQTYNGIMKSLDNQEELKHAVKSYRFLSRDSSIFFDLPAIFLGLEKNKIEPTKTQILACRSLELVGKDLRDLTHDLKEESTTPATAFFNKNQKKSIVLERLRAVRTQIISTIDWRNQPEIEKYMAKLVSKSEI